MRCFSDHPYFARWDLGIDFEHREPKSYGMTYGQALLYGAIQGVTEYLPVSSSAHLILLPKFLGTQDPGLTFDVFLHVGTLLATLIYFWREWLVVASSVPGLKEVAWVNSFRSDTQVSWKLIVIATLPALVAGALVHEWAETIFRGNVVQAVTLVTGGLLLFLSDRLIRERKDLSRITPFDAVMVGIAQCFALVPGMSRSGSTMTGARALGFDRASAAKFSFLISAPITAAAIVFELRNFDQLLASADEVGPILVAGASSFVFGILAIGGLIRMLRRFGYLSFAIYRIALAIAIIQILGI